MNIKRITSDACRLYLKQSADREKGLSSTTNCFANEFDKVGQLKKELTKLIPDLEDLLNSEEIDAIISLVHDKTYEDLRERGLVLDRKTTKETPVNTEQNPEMHHRKHVDIYTDGACKGNPGPGGWGAIVVFANTEKELSGGEPSTTNNRMELTAVIQALSILKEPCNVTLTTDSKYIVDAINMGWLDGWKNNGWKKADKKPVLNPDLWKELLQLLDVHNVTFAWCKGHADHPYNIRCDTLASTFASSFSLQPAIH